MDSSGFKIQVIEFQSYTLLKIKICLVILTTLLKLVFPHPREINNLIVFTFIWFISTAHLGFFLGGGENFSIVHLIVQVFRTSAKCCQRKERVFFSNTFLFSEHYSKINMQFDYTSNVRIRVV